MVSTSGGWLFMIVAVGGEGDRIGKGLGDVSVAGIMGDGEEEWLLGCC